MCVLLRTTYPYWETRECGLITATVCDKLGRATYSSSCLYEDATTHRLEFNGAPHELGRAQFAHVAK